MYEQVKDPYRTGCEVHNKHCQLNFSQIQGSTQLRTEVVLDRVTCEHEARGVKSLKI